MQVNLGSGTPEQVSFVVNMLNEVRLQLSNKRDELEESYYVIADACEAYDSELTQAINTAQIQQARQAAFIEIDGPVLADLGTDIELKQKELAERTQRQDELVENRAEEAENFAALMEEF